MNLSSPALGKLLLVLISGLALLWLVMRQRRGDFQDPPVYHQAAPVFDKLGLIPNHNFLFATKGWSPFFHAGNQGNAIYTSLIEKEFLLIFTKDMLIIKAVNQETVHQFTHNEIQNFTYTELDDEEAFISFKVRSRRYYFYFRENATVALLKDRKFLGLG